MSENQTRNEPHETDPTERPDPPGNPAEHTAPRENQEIDQERLARELEELDRTIGA